MTDESNQMKNQFQKLIEQQNEQERDKQEKKKQEQRQRHDEYFGYSYGNMNSFAYKQHSSMFGNNLHKRTSVKVNNQIEYKRKVPHLSYFISDFIVAKPIKDP